MAYVDGLLASGEQVLRREHQHWFVLVSNAVNAIIAWIVAVVVLVLSATLFRDNGTIGPFLGWIVVVLVLVGVAWFGWQTLRWQNEEFVVTSRRVLQIGGVLNKRVLDSSLEKINDAILTESLFGRIFGFGDLEILTASETGVDRIHMIRDAGGFKKAMLDAKHELELELSGAKPMPSPAIRAVPPMTPVDEGPPPASADASATEPVVTAPQPAPAAPTGSNAPVAPVAPAASAEEITKTLASLAELRDSGAITAEDYEAKKSDLLRRL